MKLTYWGGKIREHKSNIKYNVKKLLSHIEYFVVLSILVSLYTSNNDKNDYHDNDSNNDDHISCGNQKSIFLIMAGSMHLSCRKRLSLSTTQTPT